jgi:hypothetical protein
MNRAERRSKSTRKCEVVDYIGGPHDGCDEFAPPVEVKCGQPAVVRVVTGDRHRGRRIVHMLVCADHRAELTAPISEQERFFGTEFQRVQVL